MKCRECWVDTHGGQEARYGAVRKRREGLFLSGVMDCWDCKKVKPLPEMVPLLTNKYGRLVSPICRMCSRRKMREHWSRQDKAGRRAIYERYKRTRNANPEKRMRQAITNRLRVLMRQKVLQARARKGLDRGTRSGTAQALGRWVGCSWAELRKYLGQQFTEGMTWSNYGEWHIDHVIPLCQFDVHSDGDMSKAWHYSNLRPLWAKENQSRPKKGSVIYQPELMTREPDSD